ARVPPRRAGHHARRRVPARLGPAGGADLRRRRRARPQAVLRARGRLDRPDHRSPLHRPGTAHRHGAPGPDAGAGARRGGTAAGRGRPGGPRYRRSGRRAVATARLRPRARHRGAARLRRRAVHRRDGQLRRRLADPGDHHPPRSGRNTVMTATSPTPEPPNAPSEPARRSTSWFGADGKMGFVHRSKLYNSGRSPAMFDGRPVIGICNSWSELTPCNRHLRDIAEAVKRGVLLAGGFPLEFPTMSRGEALMRPSAMLYRNLMAMEVEENLRSYPLDGVVLLAGCDKTVPAQLMGALSADLPAIMLTGGPMLNGKFRGPDAGSGTHVWQFAEEVRAGRLSREEVGQAEACR